MLAATLANQQEAFIEFLLDESRATPEGWDESRFAVYRNAYRSRLVDAVRETYPRTERWVGDDAFRRAAVHHVIQHPSKSWTLDAIGEGLPETLAALFTKNPEVSELAWLEWAMHTCFVAANPQPIDVSGFQAATADFEEDDWSAMRLRFVPGTQVAPVRHRVDALWSAMVAEKTTPSDATDEYCSSERIACIVWRQGFVPVAATVSAHEGTALAMMLAGAPYGDACDYLARELGTDAAVTEAGAMLGRWIHNGMLSHVGSSSGRPQGSNNI